MSTIPFNAPEGPGIIVHTVKSEPRRLSLTHRRSTLAERSMTMYGARQSGVVSLDRLSYLNTALEALPGITLQKHFSPIVKLRRSVWERRRLTRERLAALGPTQAARREKDALQSLGKALTEAAGDLVPGYSVPLDVKALGELLEGKLEPISFKTGSVLYYPQEPPEALFVYIIVEGGVTVTQYQPQTNRATMLGGERKQYFTSGKETLRLCGGGVLEGTLLTAPDLLGGPVNNNADQDVNNSSNNNNNNNNDAVSMSNVTTAIQRGLREASRAVGQPTLQASRTDLLRAPIVFGAAEAMGMSPFKSMSCIAAGKGDGTGATDVYRIRAMDLQLALQTLAKADHSKKKGNFGEFVAAARTKSIATYYYPTEVLIRQSWLLQDTPTATIRNLMTQLTPHTFMPGELITCPHQSNTPSARQLIFLRRGEISVVEPPTGSEKRGCPCDLFPDEGEVLEYVHPGSSFGELSILFGEPRHFTLRAITACDVWILSHENFSRIMRRDEALRSTLVTKAAALRIKWLGEQRFTTSLAHQLRKSCEMFRPFNQYTLRLIQERIQPVVFSPGELVASTSGRCEEMIFIMQGKVTSISGADVVYGRGDVLGAGCLVAHRWPIGLSARTMVEGWRLHRDDLLDALERMDRLYSYSGVYSSEVSSYMQQIYRNPLPDVEVDVVGRAHMPIIPMAPGNVSYVLYGRQVSEIQLKALCFLFKDYVKWEDICYATMGVGTELPDADSLARQLTVDTLRGSTKMTQNKRPTPPALSDRLANRSVNSATTSRKGKNATVEDAANTVPPLPPRTQGSEPLKNRKKKNNNTGACAFLVDPNYFSRPFMTRERQIATDSRRPVTAPPNPPMKEKGNDAIVSQSAARIKEMSRRPPRLQRFQKLLEERDRLVESEAQAEKEMDRNRSRQEGAAIQNYLSTVSSAQPAGGKVGPLFNPLSPVHLFLSSPKPRAEITMAEAISIGYILQFPDTSRIQACVSLIDPDITIGLPAHRGRRRAMACTPNDRHVKNNFLFATSTFIDTMSTTVDVQLEERRLSEYNKRNKALKLLNMLKVNTEPHTPVKAVDTSVDDYNTSSQLYIGNTPTTAEERINVEEPAVQVVATVTPLRMTQSSVPSTPSPFRASPARGPQQEEEQFVRLLARDSRRALNLLQQRYLPKPAGTIPRPGSAQRVSTPLSGAGRGAVLWDRLRSAVVREEEDRTPPLTPHEESEEQEVLFTNTDLPLPPMGQAMPRDYWRTENYFCPAEAKSLDMERYFSVGDGILYVERHGALEEPSSPAVRKNVVLPYYPSSPLVDHFSASGQAPLASTSSRTSMMWRTGDREQDEHYVLTPNDFMMPDSSEAMAVVRRIQRDVTGMNEVAKEQTKRRGEEALQARVEALLSHPTEEENQLMEDWHTSYYITAKDPLQSALIPKALLPYAGPDYVTQDLRALAQQHTWRPPARSGVEEWQEEQETRRGPDAARRVLATYGSSQLGLPILPLATPLTGLSSEDHHGWVTEREELFRNYAMQKKDDVVALPPLM